MVNALQLIASIPLFMITFPGNLEMFFSFITDIASFNIIPTDTITSSLFNKTGSIAYNSGFE
jgi:hypothetical protein